MSHIQFAKQFQNIKSLQKHIANILQIMEDVSVIHCSDSRCHTGKWETFLSHCCLPVAPHAS
jgi:hypothetical protein